MSVQLDDEIIRLSGDGSHIMLDDGQHHPNISRKKSSVITTSTDSDPGRIKCSQCRKVSGPQKYLQLAPTYKSILIAALQFRRRDGDAPGHAAL